VGAVNVFTYVQAVYLLPYAVLAVPIATSAFPALAHAAAAEAATEESVAPTALDAPSTPPARTAQGGPAEGPAVLLPAHATLAWSLRAVLLLTAGAAAVLIAVARPVGVFFGSLDRGRHAGGGAALEALPGALSAYAPGVVGFGVAALLTRALYVRGRPLYAALAVAAGWLVAGMVPLVLLPEHSSAGATLGVLGVSSTVGMTLSGGLLVLLVRRSWGAAALVGSGRTLTAAVVAVAVALVVGDLVSRALAAHGLWSALASGAVVAVVTGLGYLGVMALGDRRTVLGLRDRGRLRRRGAA
jgi:putative peptidoglycan lipid II flippase